MTARAVLCLFACVAAGSLHAQVRYDERHAFAAAAPQSGAQHGVTTSADGDVVVAGAPGEDGSRGAVYVYERQRGGYAFRQRLVSSDRQANDRFGLHVDVDVGTIAVGAIGSNGIGAAYVFTRDAAGTWTQRQRLVGARTDNGGGREAGDDFGVVALDGDDLVVGAPGSDNVGIINADPRRDRAKGSVVDIGVVFHFVRSASTGLYTQRDMFVEPGFTAGNRFGESVDISGNRFVAGARNGEGLQLDSGTAWVFSRSSPAVSFGISPQEIFANDGTTGDLFTNVRMSGNTILVGAPLEDLPASGSNQGAAYVFQFTGATFTQVQKLLPQTAGSGELYGYGIAIDGDVLLAGPLGPASYAELWTRSGGAGAWTRAPTRITARTTVPGDFFGSGLDVSDNTVVIGASARQVAGLGNAGVVHVFERDEASGLSRQRRFTSAIASPAPTDRGRFDLVGSSVAINERWLVAGAPGVERFNAQILAFQTVGAAYVFDRTSTAQPAVLSAAGLASGDRFGGAVAISPDGDTIVVGASEAGAGDPGEVYVFAMPVGGWIGTIVAPAPVTIGVACGVRDGFARAVAVRDDGLVLVGAPLGNAGAGAAYVLRPNGATYDAFCIPPPNPGAPGQFGADVVIEGVHLYIGAPEESRAYHYEMQAGGPVFRHTLAGATVASDTVVADAKQIIGNKFGSGIDAEGDVIVVGAPLADTSVGTDAGMAYVYELEGSTIDATAELIGDKFGPGANAGTSVATNGDVIVLGAPLADPEGVIDAGGAYAYERPPGGWLGLLQEDGSLDAPEPNTSGLFGLDVAATADAVAIGEPQDDGPTIDGVPADNQGSAFSLDFAEFMLQDGFE